MDIAKPNAHGVLPDGQREIVASRPCSKPGD
jgi:hypothetical protein